MNDKDKKLMDERFQFLSSCHPSLRQAIVCLSHYSYDGDSLVRSQVKAALVCLGYPMKITNPKSK